MALKAREQTRCLKGVPEERGEKQSKEESLNTLKRRENHQGD